MILLLASLAGAECSLDAAVAGVRDQGRRDSYDCLTADSAGGSRLVLALYETPADPRLSRALALWMLQRADQPFDPLHVVQLVPADLRFLADGVRARRGRQSPVPEHHAVFSQFAWYQPAPTYTDGRLKPGDREQVALLDRPLPTSSIAPPAEEPDSRAAQAVVPVLLVLAGLGGAAWYLRRPPS